MAKHIDIGEFRSLGGVQETNRLCLHPAGFALEVTIVDPEGWSEDNERVQKVADAIMGCMYGSLVDVDDEAKADMHRECTELAIASMTALYPPGSQHLSGVWDYREDKEGIIFGDGFEGKAEQAAAFAAERERHREYRTKLFGGDSDVEPLDWTITDEQLEELKQA